VQQLPESRNYFPDFASRPLREQSCKLWRYNDLRSSAEVWQQSCPVDWHNMVAAASGNSGESAVARRAVVAKAAAASSFLACTASSRKPSCPIQVASIQCAQGADFDGWVRLTADSGAVRLLRTEWRTEGPYFWAYSTSILGPTPELDVTPLRRTAERKGGSPVDHDWAPKKPSVRRYAGPRHLVRAGGASGVHSVAALPGGYRPRPPSGPVRGCRLSTAASRVPLPPARARIGRGRVFPLHLGRSYLPRHPTGTRQAWRELK
jgi:hypothetical protein